MYCKREKSGCVQNFFKKTKEVEAKIQQSSKLEIRVVSNSEAFEAQIYIIEKIQRLKENELCTIDI